MDAVPSLTIPTFDTFEQAYVAVLRQVHTNYQYVNAPRGNACHECINVSFTLSDPRQRLPYLAARACNVVYHFAEVLWYLRGRDDLDMIGYYAPAMANYSADGLTLAGTAYGRPLFAPLTPDGVSQWDQVLQLLRNDPASKRAVISFFRPEELTIPSNPDVSCAIAVQFLLRDGRLHAVCFMRGNDSYMGLLGDVFAFTFLQEFAAVQLGAELGTYTHHAASMHINDRDSHRVRKILFEVDNRTGRPVNHPFPAIPATASWKDVRTVLEVEHQLRTNQRRLEPGDVYLDGYWSEILMLLEVYRQIRHEPDKQVEADVLSVLTPANRWLIAHRWPNRMPPDAATAP